MTTQEENPNSVTLVSRQPCLNGYTNTIDHIGSGINPTNTEEQPQPQPQGMPDTRPNKPSLLLTKSKFNEKDVLMSPGLKSALNKSNVSRIKDGSVFKKNQFNEEKKLEEENKENKN